MERTDTGYLCSSCHNIEWFTEETTSMSSVAKCPHCGSVSPNIIYCTVCGEPIDEKARKMRNKIIERDKKILKEIEK